MSEAERLYRRVNMMTGRGIIQATNDADGVHRVQVRLTPRETIDDVPVVQIYGFASHAKPTSEAHLLFATGDRSKAVAVATNDPSARPRNTAHGEVVIYTDEGDTIALNRNHQVSINSSGALTVSVPSVGFNAASGGKTTISVAGDIHTTGQITADTINAPNGQVGTGSGGGGGTEGPPGPQGPAGEAATIAVGTTTTGAPGTPAAVTNTGTSSAAVFDFTIPQGVAGATGATGPQGPAGATGATGPQGATGPAGAQGVKGDTGATGPQGAKGDTGAAGAQGATGPAGATGPQGATGAAGAAATIAVGTTTTGAPGTQAAVTNTGTSAAAVFNFTIPRGATGATGSTGATGPQGSTGAAGAAATIAVGTTTTGAPGTAASVTNTGTSAAAVFNFTIPQGATGATGPQGPQGPAGTAPATTLTGDVTGTGTGTVPTTLANSGVTAGTYQGITVNAKGLVTAASAQGYQTKSQTDALYLPLASGTLTGVLYINPSAAQNDQLWLYSYAQDARVQYVVNSASGATCHWSAGAIYGSTQFNIRDEIRGVDVLQLDQYGAAWFNAGVNGGNIRAYGSLEADGGGTIKISGASNPLYLTVDNGYGCGAIFTVTNTRAWTVGPVADGTFYIWDNTSGASAMSLDAAGNATHTGWVSATTATLTAPPTADPHIKGHLWADPAAAYVLKVSQG